MYKIYTNNLCRLMRHALNVPLDPEPFMIRFNVPAKRQIIMSIKLTAVFLFLVILQVSATGSAQSLTLKGKSISLKQLFREIRKQTGYDVLYQPDKVNTSATIDADFNKAPLKQVLDETLGAQSLSYMIDEKTIVVRKTEPTSPDKPEKKATTIVDLRADISGMVTDSAGKALTGAFVVLAGTGYHTLSDDKGNFILPGIPPGSYQLVISYIGYQTQKQTVQVESKKLQLLFYLRAANDKLDEVQVIGYGTTSRRLGTGSVSTIAAKDIEDQPVSNVLEALSGRAPGVYIQTNNGLPGGDISIQIRGPGSIESGKNPLYIIDGVPFPSTSLVANTALGDGINGAINPLNSLNPGDIESISILKDADATAIYGSRGANGVVLITTKKGKKGKVQTVVSIEQGVSRVADLPKLLDLQNYLMIRREAFKNDGLTPSSDPTSSSYAPDLTVWSQTNSTNWAKYIMGGTGRQTNLQASVSGGDEQTTFDIGTNFRTQSTVLQGDNRYNRGGMHMSVAHNSADKKFYVSMTASYTADNNQLVNPYVTNALLPPNFPLYNADGSFNFLNGANPAASDLNTTNIQTSNIITNAIVSYNLLPQLQLKVSAGLNDLSMKQVMVDPQAAQDPNSYQPQGETIFGNNGTKSFIVEPQLNYSLKRKRSSLAILLGGTWQKTDNDGETIIATNFNSQSQLENEAAAATLQASNSDSEYKYASVFGRITYNLDDKYIVNASARRDGSSRFAPGDQYGNFGALGLAWLFSNESWIKNNLDWLSFGKIRSSYGITGNDQIGDYQYLSTYSGSSYYVYQNNNGLIPSNVANNNFHWESNRKLEFGLDLGLFKDKILFTADHFIDRTSDQLIYYTLPAVTGFYGYEANLPAVVQNEGWEFEISTKNIQGSHFRWSSNFNFTVNRNTLESFPGLASSSYSQIFIIGQSILRTYGYKLAEIDPKTGLALYDVKGGAPSSYPSFDNFFTTEGDQNPDFYGGMNNSFTFDHFQLDVFTQFAKHNLNGGVSATPGLLSNNFNYMLQRWQKPGDITNVPKASTYPDYNYLSSSANFFNATYLRIKTVALSYTVPDEWLKSKKINQLKIYADAENLLTFWNSNTALYDPESGANSNVPPLRTIIVGAQLTF
jgi:TonB-linked SusC/RagA family outer membrane protein